MAFNSNKVKQFGNYFTVGVVGLAVYGILSTLWGLDSSADMAGIVDLLRVPLTVAYGGIGAFVALRNISLAERNRINSDLDAIATSVVKRDKAINSLKNVKDPNSTKVERAKKAIETYTKMQIKHSERLERSMKKNRSKLVKNTTTSEIKELEDFIAQGKKGKLTSISQLAVRKI